MNGLVYVEHNKKHMNEVDYGDYLTKLSHKELWISYKIWILNIIEIISIITFLLALNIIVCIVYYKYFTKKDFFITFWTSACFFITLCFSLFGSPLDWEEFNCIEFTFENITEIILSLFLVTALGFLKVTIDIFYLLFVSCITAIQFILSSTLYPNPISWTVPSICLPSTVVPSYYGKLLLIIYAFCTLFLLTKYGLKTSVNNASQSYDYDLILKAEEGRNITPKTEGQRNSDIILQQNQKKSQFWIDLFLDLVFYLPFLSTSIILSIKDIVSLANILHLIFFYSVGNVAYLVWHRFVTNCFVVKD